MVEIMVPVSRYFVLREDGEEFGFGLGQDSHGRILPRNYCTPTELPSLTNQISRILKLLKRISRPPQSSPVSKFLP
jgi:hypothetical protein